MQRAKVFIFSFLVVFCAGSVSAQDLKARFISLEEARPVLQRFSNNIPSELTTRSLDANAWSRWVQQKDRQIRDRLRRGEEDTITNLLRFGVTFTKEARIDRESLSLFGSSPLVNSIAERRANDLIRALASRNANEGIQQARALLEQEGYSFGSAQQRGRLKKHLLDNLARMRDEFNQYREMHKTATLAQRSHLYEERGISLDSNLWPDYALDRSLREILQSGLLKQRTVKRIAIVGPGLDFANKDYGNDFYPPQTIQPFAVVDSLARLGIADPATVEIYTFDISRDINIHLRRASQKAAAGTPYTVQLPWSSKVPFSSAYLTSFTQYWQSLGDLIGKSTRAATIPAEVAQDIHIRAVMINPQVISHVTPMDMNIVFQRLPATKFDLIIGTNIFIYYDAFQQSLARANLASMLNPGGLVMTNDLLASEVPSHLDEVHRTQIDVTQNGAIKDFIFCYRKN